MSDPTSDDDLKTLYARHRDADREHAPEFQAMRGRALTDGATARSNKPAIPQWAWPLAAAAAVVVALVVFPVRPRPPTPPALTSRDEVVHQIAQIDAALQRNLAQQSITAWQSPTDFLLKPITTEIP